MRKLIGWMRTHKLLTAGLVVAALVVVGIAAPKQSTTTVPTATPATTVATTVAMAETPAVVETPVATVETLATTPEAAVTAKPAAEPAKTQKPAGIVPCVDGSQDSCAVYQIAFSTFGTFYPDASIAWLDCVATYLSNTYTLEEAATLDGSDDEVAALVNACGWPE
jgi:hypothetical protein